MTSKGIKILLMSHNGLHLWSLYSLWLLNFYGKNQHSENNNSSVDLERHEGE